MTTRERKEKITRKYKEKITKRLEERWSKCIERKENMIEKLLKVFIVMGAIYNFPILNF